MRATEVTDPGVAVPTDPVTLSTVVFYAGNMLAVSTYVILMALIMRPKGFMGNGAMPTPVVALAVLFLASCCMLHLELAYRGYTGGRIVENGVVDAHFLILSILKPALLMLWIFVAARGRRGREDELVIEDFERRAQDALDVIEDHAAEKTDKASEQQNAETGR